MPVAPPCWSWGIFRFSASTYGCMKLIKLTMPIVKNEA